MGSFQQIDEATSSALHSPVCSLSVNLWVQAPRGFVGLGEPRWRCMPPTGVPALAGDGADARVRGA